MGTIRLRSLGLLAASAAVFSGALLVDRDARACGGCFHEITTQDSPESTVVTDHRMAFAISTAQTVLWDQVRYQGNPAEFAWVLPVRPGTQVELSRDAWIAALDASTQPVILAPVVSHGFGGGGSPGCGCGSMSTTASGLDDGRGTAPPVTVVSEKVVGPYESVTLRATDPGSLEKWLGDHGFVIPDAVKPTISAYTSEGFDFIALRLRPGEGVRAMQPVRITSPGADASLPLRMIAAGVGSNVGLTLFVISEGRYEAQNFPNALVDDQSLFWDAAQERSNYQELVTGLMAQKGGTTWVTEHAQPAEVVALNHGQGAGSFFGTQPGLADAYFGACTGEPPVATFQNLDAGLSGEDGGDAAADTADASETSDASNAGTTDAGTDADQDAGDEDAAPPAVVGCKGYDDLNVAMTGLHASDVWVTRLRASFPVDALKAGDLHLSASARQTEVASIHQSSTPSSTVSAGLATERSSRAGVALTIALAMLAIGRLTRRLRA